MPVKVFPVHEFLELQASMPCVDTRSEAEFAHAHLPQSQNIALLNNDERAIVGTTYKQNGNEAAVLKGYELVGGEFADYIRQAKKLAPEKKIAVYCWRGGMRSNIRAQLFSNAGFEVSLLIGGYKAFRNFVLDTLKEPSNIWIVGGKTGSNKTTILNLMKEYGAQSIDLEGLANHKGSAFGALGMPPQPSSEMMENMLALQWKNMNPELPLFLENESSKIGSVKINDDITNMMRLAKTITIEKSVEQRMQSIMHEYGNFPSEDLIACTMKLKKRLGGLRMQQAIDFLNENKKTQWLQNFNTPKVRYNLGISNRNVVKNVGMNVVYRWQDSFYWASSFASGDVPAFGTVDAQVNLNVPSVNGMIKIGASDLSNKYFITSYGNPAMGGMYYVGFTFNQ